MASSGVVAWSAEMQMVACVQTPLRPNGDDCQVRLDTSLCPPLLDVQAFDPL
jgi:hypothetical protein